MGIDMLGSASILHYSNISMILGGIFDLQSIEKKKILFLNTNLGIFLNLFILWYLKKKKLLFEHAVQLVTHWLKVETRNLVTLFLDQVNIQFEFNNYALNTK